MITARGKVGEFIGGYRLQVLVRGGVEEFLAWAINGHEDKQTFIQLAYFRAPAVAMPPTPGIEIVHLSCRRRRKL